MPAWKTHACECLFNHQSSCVCLLHKVWQTQRKAHCWMCHSRMGPLWLFLTISLTEIQMNFPTTKTRRDRDSGEEEAKGKVFKMNWLVLVYNLRNTVFIHPFIHRHSSRTALLNSILICRHTHSHTYAMIPKIQNQINRRVCVIQWQLGEDGVLLQCNQSISSEWHWIQFDKCLCQKCHQINMTFWGAFAWTLNLHTT